MKESAIQIQGKKRNHRNHRFFLNSSRGASVHLLSKSVFITLVKDFVCRVGGGLLGCCDWLAASRVLFSSLWWWCIMPHPLLVIGLLTTFLLFFLPDLWWPWPVTRFIISTIYFTVWLTQPSWLAAAAGSVQHHWIMLHSWCTLIFFWSYFTFFFFWNPYHFPALWNNHAGHDLGSCLLRSGGLSGSHMCPISSLFPWDHCGSGRLLSMCLFDKMYS